MAIPTPTVPSTDNPISAVDLRPIQSGKAFYINSGLISANNTETTVISVNDIGRRDILFCINPMHTDIPQSDTMSLRLKVNGELVYQTIYMDRYDTGPANDIHFIIPANCSIEITFQNSTSTSHDVGISAYGYYL